MFTNSLVRVTATSDFERLPERHPDAVDLSQHRLGYQFKFRDQESGGNSWIRATVSADKPSLVNGYPKERVLEFERIEPSPEVLSLAEYRNS